MEFIVQFIADGLLVIGILVALGAFYFAVPKKKWKYWAIRIFGTGVTTYGLAKLIGWLYQPETLRPFEKLGVDPGAMYLNNPGFPSDHVLFLTFLTLAVWFSTRNKLLGAIMLLITLLTAIGRVLALVHTPLDVIGGMLIALVGIIWYIPWGKHKRLVKNNIAK